MRKAASSISFPSWILQFDITARLIYMENIPAVDIYQQIEHENRELLAAIFGPLVIGCLANPDRFTPEFVSVVTAFVGRNTTSERLLAFYEKLTAWEKNGSVILKELS